MAERTDWLPGRREQQLALAQNWLTVLQNQSGNPWNIPPDQLTVFQGQISDTRIIFEQAQSSARTPVITAECKAAFDLLVEKMRFFKGHYFLKPPLTDTDYISLELKPKDIKPTPTPAPTAQAEADIARPGVHLLELYLRPVSGSPPDPHRADYGCRIYYGVLPPGGATVEQATGSARELMKAPASGEDLPHSRFTRRKRELFDFAQENSGKTVYFCIRYENAKGEPGPWGPIISAIIP